MPFNLTKKYPELLEIAHYDESSRIDSLKAIFNRDIQNNENFNFRSKQIRPIKIEGESSMEILFNHLIKDTITVVDEKGRKIKKRVFDIHRSIRMHWIKYHIEENKKDKVEIFSYTDRVDNKDVVRTYIYDIEQKYVVILEPQRSKMDYYLITAYYFYKDWGENQIKKKLNNKLEEVY